MSQRPYSVLNKMASGTRHERFYQDIVKVMNKHTRHLGSEEILAIIANMVGKLVALQDQRTMSVRMAMDIVSKNIEQGNADAVAVLQNEPPVGHA